MSVLTDVAVVAALAGAGAAAFTGAVKYYVDLGRERRKALNRVLWCQLDLWYELKRFDAAGAFEVIAPALAQRLGIPETQHPSKETVAAVGETLAETFLNTRSPDLDQKYAGAVEELAFFEPVLAHSVSERTALQHYREQTKNYMNILTLRLNTEAPDADVMTRFMVFMQTEMRQSVLEIITRDINAVAGRLNRSTRRQVRSAMKDFRERAKEDSERIDTVGQRLVTWVTTETSHPSGTTT